MDIMKNNRPNERKNKQQKGNNELQKVRAKGRTQPRKT